MKTEEELYNRVIKFIESRYPIGWGGAAIMKTEQGSFLISVALESANASAGLCMETGAMCEAQKLGEKITHSLCVTRDDEKSPYKILTPCGICQERLSYWGEDVLVGLTIESDELIFKKLKEINLFHWSKAYNSDDLEKYKKL